MCVATRSKNQRSWLTQSTVPAKFWIASSSARKVSTSKSFEGSSSMRTLPPRRSVFASCRRFLSPPLRVFTFWFWTAPLKLNQEQYALLRISRPPMSMMSSPPEISSTTVFSPSRPSRPWSTYIGATASPMMMSPASGFSCPMMMLKSVVLPAPLGPMMPTTAPSGTVNRAWSISMRSPYPLERSTTSIGSPFSRGPGLMMIWLVVADALYCSACSTNSSYLRSLAFPFF
mmetsp:Transcript_59444/g.181413  ORF Transcript_59444/g.181413 Transcript_59444/m.181413 type:complete len:230 (+) Transcript_59444:165-854(+)